MARDQSVSAAIVPRLAAAASAPRLIETSFTTSPFSTVELFQSGSSTVEDTTYLGRPFILSARSLLRGGQSSAKIS